MVKQSVICISTGFLFIVNIVVEIKVLIFILLWIYLTTSFEGYVLRVPYRNDNGMDPIVSLILIYHSVTVYLSCFIMISRLKTTNSERKCM